MSMNTTFSERVAIVVKSSGLNQTEFASKIRISQQYLSQICNGRKTPSDRTIKDICREFHVNETWLHTGIGNMKSETTQREKIADFFTDVLATAPDDRSAFVSALADLPPEFWPLVVELAKNITEKIKKEEG